MKLKKAQLIIIASLAFLILGGIWLVWLITVGPLSVDYLFNYRYRYRECEPEKLLPDLGKAFDINFPQELKDVKAARTPGCWDGPTSQFVVRFSAEPNIVATFLKSFPMKVTFEAYKRQDDERRISHLRTPCWFTQTIKEGKWAWIRPDIVLYVDTTNKNDFVVYLRGYYHRDPNEIKQELEKERKAKLSS